MEILQLSEGYYPNLRGGAMTSWETSERLARSGHNVTVYTQRREDLPRNETESEVKIRRPFRCEGHESYRFTLVWFFRRLLWMCCLTALLLYKYRSKEKPDILYSTEHTTHPIASILSYVYDIPMISFVGYSPIIDQSVPIFHPYSILERFNFRNSMGDRTIARMQEVIDYIEKNTSAQGIRITGAVNEESVRNAASVNTSDMRESVGVQKDDKLILFIGALNPVKQPIAAVEVIDSLPSDYKLRMIGKGSLEEKIKSEIKNRNLENRTSLLGQIPHERVIQLLISADIVILPSRTESYGRVAFEGFVTGCFVAARPVGILPDLTEERLKICEINEMPEAIKGMSGEYSVDEDRLEKYSMATFTRTVEDAMLKEVSESGEL